jgi:hypothetical protein
MNLDFNNFWEKQRALEPDEPKMISLCKILQGSGEDKDEIEKIFHTYMKVTEDYDAPELEEMINYLLEILFLFYISEYHS